MAFVSCQRREWSGRKGERARPVCLLLLSVLRQTFPFPCSTILAHRFPPGRKRIAGLVSWLLTLGTCDPSLTPGCFGQPIHLSRNERVRQRVHCALECTFVGIKPARPNNPNSWVWYSCVIRRCSLFKEQWHRDRGPGWASAGYTGSLSHLRAVLPESRSRPMPARRPNHAT